VTGFVALEDGEVFRGESVGADGIALGEAVFTTAMTGYQETVTDPSYAEQIVCFTAPMVGNYGVAEERSQSDRPWARAAVMREARGPEWIDWLREHGIVALSGIDTRALVLHLRESGSLRAGASVTVYPHDVDSGSLAGYDGVLLSNGPGDPEPLRAEVETVRELLGRVPLLGICLGHQLLALAAGHETFKLRFGHRGANHPVLERASGRVLVTSQNHGFAVVASDAKEATHVSLYDGTVEGLELPALRARSVQFHPEAGPGPHDAWPLLERWVEEVSFAQAA
jgi:carbamoyl-phosphate synthase small subunit